MNGKCATAMKQNDEGPGMEHEPCLCACKGTNAAPAGLFVICDV